MTSSWYFAKAGAPAGQEAGPFSWDQLFSLAQAGEVTPADLVRSAQQAEWVKAGQMPGLFRTAAAVGGQGPYPGTGPFAPAAAAAPHSWYPWAGTIAALVIIGAGLGIYFGLLRGGDESVATIPTGGAVTTATVAGGTSVGPGTTGPAATLAAPWNNLNPGGDLPSIRDGQSMVYDPTSGKVLLFGGQERSQGVDLNDSWAYDAAGNTWAKLNPKGALPPARSAASLAHDPTTGHLILFGGFSRSADFNDTWVYDFFANAWTELTPGGSRPSARAGHALVYDPGTAKMILFGGWDGESYLGDTWAYDPVANTWTDLSPGGDLPAARAYTQMVYDSESGRLILFGGEREGSTYADTWAYDPVANTWVELDPAGDLPAARTGHALVYDAAITSMVLFGGVEWKRRRCAQRHLGLRRGDEHLDRGRHGRHRSHGAPGALHGVSSRYRRGDPFRRV